MACPARDPPRSLIDVNGDIAGEPAAAAGRRAEMGLARQHTCLALAEFEAVPAWHVRRARPCRRLLVPDHVDDDPWCASIGLNASTRPG